jgi:hypothetical protein
VLRRHLLFFVTGALLALAVVLVVRAGDDGSATGSAVSTSTSPSAAGSAGTVSRSVRLRSHRHVLRGHHPTETSSTKAPATAGAAAGGTGGSARPGGGGAGTEPSPGIGTVPHDPAATVPDDSTETVPGDGGQTTEPPADPQTSTGTATPPAESGAGVTIPNPATPDASVAP